MVSKIHVYEICMHVQHHCIVYPLCMLYNRYSRFTEPWGMWHWCSALFGCLQPLNWNTLSFCICGSCCTDLRHYVQTLLWWKKKANTSLGYYAADSSHALLLWRHCIFLLHCQSSVRTVCWISAGPSQLLQSCVLLFICVCCDCSSLCFCWNWFSVPLALVVDFAHWFHMIIINLAMNWLAKIKPVWTMKNYMMNIILLWIISQ